MKRIELPHDNCYLLVLKNCCKLNEIQFSHLLALRPKERGHVVIRGIKRVIPRYQRLFGESNYRFSGVTVRGEKLECSDNTHKDYWGIQILQSLLDYVNKLEPKYNYNGLLYNVYPTGEDYIGPHSDDERDLVEGAPIYSFSFGCTRTFRFHPRKGGKKVLDIDLEDGMLVAMCGNTQKHFKHSVPKRKNINTPRINVTVRAFRV